MTTTEELNALLRQALNEPDRVTLFLRAFLEAPAFVLAPLSDDHPRLRFFMYRRPEDGIHFIPLFTDEEKATASAEGQLRVLPGTGRLWLEASRGAVVVINPNDEHCTLYPEEITDLLTNGRVADLDCERLTAARQVWIGDPEAPPAWLISKLQALYRTLPFVEAARLFEMYPEGDSSKGILTVAITTTKMYEERAARATITSIQSECQTAKLPVDIVVTVSDDRNPQFVGWGVLIYARND